VYECGETPIHQAWFNFNPRFYIVALIFLIFDVEVAFTYPVAVVFKRWVEEGAGYVALFEIALFVGILAIGLAYIWVKGDLEWVRRSKDDAEWKLIQTRLPPTRAELDAERQGK
jgi:NADH-quinone oxidoreductase subunit A